jgi:nicotinamidase-related amidase
VSKLKKALIVVDYQYDFVADDGKLTVGTPAQKIEKNIAALAELFDENDIYFTFDNHSEADWESDIYPEPKVFPVHCIKGTKGYTIYGEIKGSQNKINHIEKHAYCPDANKIKELVGRYDQITVVGVVTDICVFQTVIGFFTQAVNQGKKLELIVDSSACASFNPEREKWALDYMKEVMSVNVK